MQKIKAYLSSLPKWQLFLIPGIIIIIISLTIFVAPMLRRQAVIKLGSEAGITVTADKEDTLGVFTDSRFTIKSDQDLTTKAVKDNLKTEPETPVEIIEVSPRQYQVVPKEPLNSNEIFKIKLSTGDREYSWAFQTRNNFRVVRTLPANKTGSVPTKTGIEITFSHDNYENIDSYFSISPAVKGRFERHQRTVTFVPDKLEPGTLYSVTIKKGLKLDGSVEVLSDDVFFQFETQSGNTSIQNRFNLARVAYEFSTKEIPAIDLFANNIDSIQELKLKLYKYSSTDNFIKDYQAKLSIPRWASSTFDNFQISTNGLSKVMEFSAPVQKLNYSGYFLFPQMLSKGQYLVETENNGIKSQSLIQITDLSAYFTVSGSQTLAWVNRVDTGKSVQSASIKIFGQEYVTDKDGVASFSSLKELIADANKLIVIKDTQESLIIPAADRNYYYPYGNYQETRRVSDKYWSYLYLDRPLYQPTDTVRFWGLLRDRDAINKSQNLTISVSSGDYFDYNYTPINLAEKDYQTSSNGTFIGDIPVKNLKPGWYNLNINLDGKNILSSGFIVETYSKPAYQLSIDANKKAFIAGESIDLSGKAAFFEGTPVSNLKLKVFSDTQKDVVTDNLGNFQVSYQTTPSNDYQYYQPSYRYVSVNPVDVEEGDINAGTTVGLFNSSIFLESKIESNQDKKKITISLNQVDLNKFEPYQYGTDRAFIGAAVANHQIQAELIENTWEKKEVGTYYDFINKVTSPRYEYSQTKNSLGQFTLNTDSRGQAIYEFIAKEGKYYELKLNALDGSNRVASNIAYIYSNDYTGYQNNRLILTGDKSDGESYQINESVSLTPSLGGNPIASGKMLYLFAQRGIQGFTISDTSKFTFKFADKYVPNIYVQGVYFTGSTYQLSESKILSFDKSVKKISLDLKLDKLFYKPGEKAQLSVSTRDSKGAPISSEVNINLVDEAIYQMSPSTADPLTQVYRNLDSDIVSFYLSHQYPTESNMAEGGGCFLPDTKILLSNNKTKNIEDIKVGDLIKTRVSAIDRTLVNAKVTQVHKHEVGQYLLINNHLKVTPEHNLYINGRWMIASDIKIGDSYLDFNNKYQVVTSIEKYNGIYTVYNLTIDKYHTFFAEDFYVHNDKGRELFVDTAFFGRIQTGSNGQGSVDINLPDNLTSWRVTSQAISQDLMVGVKTEKLSVKLPFFVDIILNTNYLVEDKPVITLRGFGEELKSTDSVNFHISIPSLNLEKDLSTKAFEAVGVAIDKLSVGTHKVTVTAQSGSLKDQVTKSFTVVQSRLKFLKSDYQTMSTDIKLKGSADGSTTLVFSDQSSGKFYSNILNLSYGSGDRLDQKLARVLSAELINKYFDSSVVPEQFTSSVYAQDNGGYSLLPYGSSDLALSVDVACAAGDKFSKASLVNYFYKSFTEAKETVSAAQSLSGLACLKEPVLLLVNKLYTIKDLDPEAIIYLSMAQNMLGDKEKSIQSVNGLLNNLAVHQDNLSYVKIGKTKEDYLRTTSLLSAVAALNNMSVADNLYNYVSVNFSNDILTSTTQLIYISKKISQDTSSSVSFSYTVDGKKRTKQLEKGEAFRLVVDNSQLANIKFEDIKGNIGITSIFEQPGVASEMSKEISLDRKFLVSGKQTTEFISSDLIKISLGYGIRTTAQSGCYQVTDYLPSGLKPITRLFNRGLETKDISYPYAIDGQKVSFCVNGAGTIQYYARVVSPGQYKAENALMQSVISPSVYVLTGQSAVTIK